MSDGTPKRPSIPAWQRAKPSQPESSQTTKDAEPQQEEQGSIEEEIVRTDDDEGSGETSPSVSSQLDHIDSLLKDPEVAAASTERKRAFLESKAVPVKEIDRVLPKANISKGDFEQFKQQNQPSKSAVTSAQRPAAAPIITYPEFLVQAHKPPPLITLERVLGATYLASGAAALIYGASKFLLTPMLDTLTESRHDFASHSQSKIDEFNERLGKIVSRVPPQPRKEAETEADDVESITSDPTELFHRDMGTQTSPVASRRSSSSDVVEIAKPPPIENQAKDLGVLRQRLETITQSLGDDAGTDAARQDSMGKLRQYLDTILYASPNISLWSASEDLGTKSKSNDDAIEELKREIRGVKGVLLSARRFPAATGRVGA